MEKANRIRANVRLALCALGIIVLSACGGSGTGGAESEPWDGHLHDASVQASGNATIAADPVTQGFTPSPGNGLSVSFQDPVSEISSIDDFIGAQWEHMQTCLMVSAQEPVIIVVDGKLEPTGLTDDVVRHIDGQIQASSHVTDTSATIQVSAQDFDGSLGSEGAYLRSIMGRYLWLANGLAERDYPYKCANG